MIFMNYKKAKYMTCPIIGLPDDPSIGTCDGIDCMWWMFDPNNEDQGCCAVPHIAEQITKINTRGIDTYEQNE